MTRFDTADAGIASRLHARTPAYPAPRFGDHDDDLDGG